MIAETAEFWAGYGATGIFMGRQFARYMHDEIADQSDPSDMTSAKWAGFLLGGALWPLVTAFVGAGRIGRSIGQRDWLIMARPPKQKRRELELERVRKRTKQLERELDL